MRKICLLVMLCLVLCGCGARETFETVDDDLIQPVLGQQKDILLTVPEDAVEVRGSDGVLYLCDGYEVTAQVLSAGDLDGTLRALTGFGADALTVMETAASEMARYECAWSAAGETGDTVGRAVILDDGAYHYCVTVLADADDASGLLEVWNALFDSLTLA